VRERERGREGQGPEPPFAVTLLVSVAIAGLVVTELSYYNTVREGSTRAGSAGSLLLSPPHHPIVSF
jgi:hypothetical protein